MEHKVLKRFYDPFLKRRIMPGETIEVPEELYENYKPFIAGKPKTETKPEAKPTEDKVTDFKFTERHKKKVK